MAQLKKLVVAGVAIVVASSLYGWYSDATFNPIAGSLAAIRDVSRKLDHVNADQIHDDTKPMLDQAQATRKLPPIQTVREQMLGAAERTRQLGSAYNDANAVAHGARRDGITEGVVPPPPAPPPPPPLFAQVTTLVRPASDFVLAPITAEHWVSFRDGNAIKVGFFGPLRVRVVGHIASFTPGLVDFEKKAHALETTFESGPDGVAALPPRSSADRKFKDDANFMALLGRVCDPVDAIAESDNTPYNNRLKQSNLSCTSPFLIGSSSILCPGTLGTGELQFAINDYPAESADHATSRSMAGGFWISTEPAATQACGQTSVTHVQEEAVALAQGEVLNLPDNSVSSRQGYWRPVDVALTHGLHVTAWGEMQPRKGSPNITGPDGGYVHDALYPNPGALDFPQFKYQALLGRVCTGSRCGEAFALGSDKVVCPRGDQSGHLELWINLTREDHTSDFGDMRDRRGEYRFKIESASPGSCR